MTIDSSVSIFNQYVARPKKQDSSDKDSTGQTKLANNALAHFRVDDVSIKSLNGDKMEEAMSGLRNITQSLKEILNRNLKASNENSYDTQEIKSELSKAPDVGSLHNFNSLSAKVGALLAN